MPVGVLQIEIWMICFNMRSYEATVRQFRLGFGIGFGISKTIMSVLSGSHRHQSIGLRNERMEKDSHNGIPKSDIYIYIWRFRPYAVCLYMFNILWCVDFIDARSTHGKMRNIEIYDLLEKYNNSNDNTNNNKIIVNKAHPLNISFRVFCLVLLIRIHAHTPAHASMWTHRTQTHSIYARRIDHNEATHIQHHNASVNYNIFHQSKRRSMKSSKFLGIK